MKKALEQMRRCIETGEAADRPDLVVGIEEITELMGYSRIAELEQAFMLEEDLQRKYGTAERDYVILYSLCNFFGGARGAIHCFDLSSWNALVTRISYHRGTSMTCGFAGLAQAQLTHLNSRPCSGAVARGAPRTGVPSRQRISLTARAAGAATKEEARGETMGFSALHE